MWQKGLLDATVAMQLLGQGVGAAETPLPKTSDIGASGGDRNDNKKRPIESVNPDVSPEDLDECLAQAKRAKMETLVELVVYCIHDTFFFWGITLDDPWLLNLQHLVYMVYASSSVVCCIPVYFWWAWMHNPVIMKQHPVWYTGYASFLGVNLT